MKSKFFFFLSLFLFAVPGVILYQVFLAAHVGEANVDLRMSGRVSMVYLTLTLMVTPIATFISDTKFRSLFVRSRKILGLLACYFALFHTFQYVSLEWLFQGKYHSSTPFFSYFFSNLFNRVDALSGAVAGAVMFLLGAISNTFSIQKLG